MMPFYKKIMNDTRRLAWLICLSICLGGSQLRAQSLGIGLSFFDVNGLDLVIPVNSGKNIVEAKIGWNHLSNPLNSVASVDYLTNKANYMKAGRQSFSAFYGFGVKWHGDHRAVALRFPLGISHKLGFARIIQITGALIPLVPINLETPPYLNLAFAIRLNI